jgi:hypothetical protein
MDPARQALRHLPEADPCWRGRISARHHFRPRRVREQDREDTDGSRAHQPGRAHGQPVELRIDRHQDPARHWCIPNQGFLERVAHTVLANFPYAYCFRCLAVRLPLSEKEVREAAQVLIVRDGFRLDRRVCYGCGRTETLLLRVPGA